MPAGLLLGAAWRAARWLLAERLAPPAHRAPRPGPGQRRGVDAYTPLGLLLAATVSLAAYRRSLGRWPRLPDPRTETEKLVWLKLFAPLPVPGPADKLAVAGWIPPAFRARVRVAEVLWRAPEPGASPPEDLPPGRHFIKMNNDSGSNLALDYPLSTADRARLAGWLGRCPRPWRRLLGGEWWYDAIPPAAFVERAVAPPGMVEEWKVFVFGGRCLYLMERCAGPDGRAAALGFYDRDLAPLWLSANDLPPAPPRAACPPELALMRAAAEAIAAPLPFARVDFYRTPAGEVVLGEVTLCPSNAQIRYSDPGFDARIGALWDHLAPPA